MHSVDKTNLELKTASMNPILVEYCQRFAPPKDSPKPVFNTFFTSLSLQEHYRKLPYLHDIQNFCLRVYLALKLDQKVCIYSDYDTDAITATGTMYHGLIEFGFKPENLEFYAPDRFVEGYGMNPEAAKELATKFDLIISVDCGINSVKEAVEVSKTKCDLIITDHHHLHSVVPDCVAVVNCRMGEIYYNAKVHPELVETDRNFEKDSTSKTKIILQQLSEQISDLENTKIKEWLKLSTRKPEEYGQNPEYFLSQSVTGVGVAWFCLVWFGYFLEWVEK